MKITLTHLVTGALFAGLTSALSAQTLRSHDFNNGDFGDFNACSVSSPNYTEVEDGRVKTFWTQSGYNGSRSTKGAELCCDDVIVTKHGWYGMTVNLGADYQTDKQAGIGQIFQFYSSTFWSWTAMLDMTDGDLTMTHRASGGSSGLVEVVLYPDFPKETDMNVIIGFTLSNENAGEMQVWVNGESRYHATNINLGYAENWTNDVQDSEHSFVTFKAGQYNYQADDYSSGDTETVYYDNVTWYNGEDGYYIVDPSQGADSGSSFVPDPNETYYIDSPVHNLRLAATGSSEDAYTTSTSTTGADVEWQFVAKGNGYWHIQRAAGGTKPRLRTDSSANADMQETSSSGSFTYYDFSTGSSLGTHFLTLPNGPSSYSRLQVNSDGAVNMVTPSYSGTWESFKITEASDGIVLFRKRNASGYGLDGGNDGANGQNVYLWSYSANNVNQQWEETDRGDGFYSYTKKGTDFSLDGGNGGANGQNVYLWTTSNNNYNQHWKKVDVGGGYIQLQKRNSTGFAIDGGNGGANGQNLYLWDYGSSNQNQHWQVEYK